MDLLRLQERNYWAVSEWISHRTCAASLRHLCLRVDQAAVANLLSPEILPEVFNPLGICTLPDAAFLMSITITRDQRCNGGYFCTCGIRLGLSFIEATQIEKWQHIHLIAGKEIYQFTLHNALTAESHI